MKRIIIKWTMAATVISLITVACGDNTAKSPEGPKAAEEQNEKKFTTDSTEKNAEFVVMAVSGNQTEIRLAELAQQKATNKEVKDIAKLLYDDHTAALNDLKIIASNKNITIPTEDSEKTKDQLKDLSEKKGADFDKAWIDQLMDKHQKTINDYEKALNEVNDQDIKNWINNVLPKIRTHHDKLMASDSRLKK